MSLLQAFVFFSNWTACSEFLKEHVRTPVSLKGHTLSVQVVLEKIHPGSNQVNPLTPPSEPPHPGPQSLRSHATGRSSRQFSQSSLTGSGRALECAWSTLFHSFCISLKETRVSPLIATTTGLHVTLLQPVAEIQSFAGQYRHFLSPPTFGFKLRPPIHTSLWKSKTVGQKCTARVTDMSETKYCYHIGTDTNCQYFRFVNYEGYQI